MARKRGHDARAARGHRRPCLDAKGWFQPLPRALVAERAIAVKSAPFAISALALGGGAPSAKADESTYATLFYCIAE